jgi:PEP-CTERM motif
MNRGRANLGEIFGEQRFPKLREHKFAQPQPDAARTSTVVSTPDRKEVAMKTQIHIAAFALLAVLCLTLAALPASADILYDNGPINGNAGAWQINGGFVVSDGYHTSGSAGSDLTITGFAFAVWESPGDTLTSVDWSITSLPNGGTVYGSGTASGANLTDQFLFTNQYGYDLHAVVCNGLACCKGTHLKEVAVAWLNLQNANSSEGNPVYWDENSGPSQAYDSALGTIPSEAFTIYGNDSSTPEPSSLLLFGSGVLGIGGLLRKRLFG